MCLDLNELTEDNELLLSLGNSIDDYLKKQSRPKEIFPSKKPYSLLNRYFVYSDFKPSNHRSILKIYIADKTLALTHDREKMLAYMELSKDFKLEYDGKKHKSLNSMLKFIVN
jgi:hypothetical protein